ncbi:hypothetical protein KBD59_02005 [Candidatus Gracilibacteria bacterium]|nr:hypothetical protein [Candidatus Gracilibacteria bacterium]
MKQTILAYFDTPFTCEGNAKIIAVEKDETGTDVIILDQTIFYPQGGGQPYDLGTIESKKAVFQVTSVRYKEGIVYHGGVVISGLFKAGDEVICKVDIERRKLNSRLHSGGHLVSAALEQLGYFWEPHKGHHHPDGPYVEYKGTIELAEIEPLKKALEEKMAEIQKTDADVSFHIMTLEELKRICRFVPPYIPKDKPSRAAIFHMTPEHGGDMAIPCGGTHVARLSEIGPIIIPKIKCKEGIIKISYRL